MKTSSPHLPLLAAATVWLEHHETTGYSRRTVELYQQSARNLDRFLHANRHESSIHAIGLSHLESWKRDMLMAGCTNATVDAYVRAVRTLFRWLFETGRIFENPAAQLTSVKVGNKLGCCPVESDIRRLLDSIHGEDRVALRDRALLEIAYATGVRLEELTGLNLDALTPDGLRIVGKGGHERVAPLTTVAIETLDAYFRHGRPRFRRPGKNEEEVGLFLSTRAGGRMSSQAVALVIKRRAKACGLSITPHAIRRAFATHLLRGGATLVDVKALLGHRSFRHLKHYLRLHPGDVLSTARNSNPGRR